MAEEKTKPPFLIWGMPLLLFVSFFLYMYFGGMRGNSPIERSVVILPFEVESQDDRSVILAEGFRSDLIEVIGRNPAIKVSGSINEQKEDSPPGGTALSVEFRTMGDRFELRARLKDLTKDREVWLNIYEDDLNAERVFVVRKELANAVAKSLKTMWSPEVRSSLQRFPTTNLDALISFYRGREAYQSSQPEELPKAIEFFQMAIRLDSNFGEAFAYLALALLDQIDLYQLDPLAQLQLAQPAAQNALRLAPLSAQTQLAYGMVNLYQEDEAAALAAFKRATELAPQDPRSHYLYGTLLARDPDRTEEARDYLDRAEALKNVGESD